MARKSADVKHIASHPNYPLYAGRLSPGWLFGRPVVRLRAIFHAK